MSVVNTKLGTPPGYAATSPTSLTIGTGSMVFVTQTNLAYTPGAFVTLSANSAPTTDYMSGIVTAYNPGTGSMTVSFTVTAGSGTFNAWNLNLGSGPSIVATASPLVLGPTGIALSNGANNNVNIGTNSYIDISGPTTAFNITGFTGGTGGRFLTIWNTSGQSLTLRNTNSGSTATNQIFTNTSADVVIGGVNGAAIFSYDVGFGWWILLAYTPSPGIWQPISLLNSWTNNASYTAARYRLESDQNTIRVAGTIGSGTVTSGTQIFTLASGYRPSADRLISTTNSSSSNLILIDTSGNVSLVQVGAAIGNGYMSLEFTFPLT